MGNKPLILLFAVGLIPGLLGIDTQEIMRQQEMMNANLDSIVRVLEEIRDKLKKGKK